MKSPGKRPGFLLCRLFLSTTRHHKINRKLVFLLFLNVRFLDYEGGTVFHIGCNAADVFTDHPDAEQHHPADEHGTYHQRGPSGHYVMQDELGDQCVENKKKGDAERMNPRKVAICSGKLEKEVMPSKAK